MMIFKRSAFLIAIVGAAACLASPAADLAQEEATFAKRVWLSNIDVQAACKQQYTDAYVAITVNNGCGGWKCILNNSQYSVNMDGYCVQRWGGEAYASCGGGTVWDWQCHDRT
ncbi:hypothetical protein CVT24_012590 [Panaeolus cyanescens]|uniref:CBM1 domain-containing protein n=1 Tax=Panaeolus cyanescens TaxID=181874 RepID=A0A409YJY2_9AGAR|nr:hypothetical protein CVT24_012590 [Panaeolus cyanescens]